MGMRMGRFRKKQQVDGGLQVSGATPEAAMATRLAELCAGNPEMYQLLSKLLFLDPKKINIPLENVLSEAQDFESKGNRLRAEVAYRIAGGIALFRGDGESAKRYFSRAAEVTSSQDSDYKMLVSRVDQVVAIARQYYEATSGPMP